MCMICCISRNPALYKKNDGSFWRKGGARTFCLQLLSNGTLTTAMNGLLKCYKMDFLSQLPFEILLQITELSPELRFASRRFYLVYNDHCKHQLLKVIPFAQAKKLEPVFQQYLKTLEFWNGALQRLVSPDLLWWIPLSFLYSRKVLFQRKYTTIQSSDPFQLQDFGTLIVHKANTFHYKQEITLPAGQYSLQLALRNCENTRGLGTMRFSLQTPEYTEGFLPSYYVSEMLPLDQLTVWNIGSLAVNRTTKYMLELEEIGMYQKSGLEFEYIDFKPTDEEMFCYTVVSPHLSDVERQVHAAIQLVSEGRDPPTLQHGADIEHFYTSGERTVKMKTPSRKFKEKSKSLKQWKVPF